MADSWRGAEGCLLCVFLIPSVCCLSVNIYHVQCWKYPSDMRTCVSVQFWLLPQCLERELENVLNYESHYVLGCSSRCTDECLKWGMGKYMYIRYHKTQKARTCPINQKPYSGSLWRHIVKAAEILWAVPVNVMLFFVNAENVSLDLCSCTIKLWGAVVLFSDWLYWPPHHEHTSHPDIPASPYTRNTFRF